MSIITGAGWSVKTHGIRKSLHQTWRRPLHPTWSTVPPRRPQAGRRRGDKLLHLLPSARPNRPGLPLLQSPLTRSPGDGDNVRHSRSRTPQSSQSPSEHGCRRREARHGDQKCQVTALEKESLPGSSLQSDPPRTRTSNQVIKSHLLCQIELAGQQVTARFERRYRVQFYHRLDVLTTFRSRRDSQRRTAGT
jgi:hypothetical protein